MSVLHHNPASGTVLTIIDYLRGFQVSGTTLILKAKQPAHYQTVLDQARQCSMN